MKGSPRPRTVLFLISDTGAGHRSAANAIHAAMRLVEGQALRAPRAGSSQEPTHDPNWRAVIVDGFAECANFPLRKGVFLYGPAIKHSPRLYSRLFHMTNTVTRFQAAYRLSQPFLRQGMAQLLRRTRPDVIVSVHPLLNHITLQAMRDIGVRVPFITVITDLVSIHAAWVAPGVTACVTPTQVARDYAIAAGIPPKRVRLLGMPIDPAFAVQPGTTLAERKLALGLDANLPMILLVGGGEGAGGLEQAAFALGRLSQTAQLVIVTGRNRVLYTHLERSKASFNVPTTVYGFVHNMPELMRAADLVATKAGPGSISEAMACGLPIVLTGYIPGQEEGNVDYVLSNHIGVLAQTPAKLVASAQVLLTPGSTALEEMRANSQRLSHPRASFDIAKLALSYVPTVGATSAWAGIPRVQSGRLSRALGRRSPALQHARRAVRIARRTRPITISLPRLRRDSALVRRGLGLPTLEEARALLQRGPTQSVGVSRRIGNVGAEDHWRE
ncbi:MAG TPA: glycosyltransferase [Ktedonobacterales bacterium]|jgi:1,2-diacylglycerol 3-beta-galactosyltransferase|nr:glycosyltransferase [Ktedonobacterales bacterium]